MFNKKSLPLLLGMSALTAFGQTVPDVFAPAERSAYLQDGRGVVVRSGAGLCWRSGYWVPADAVPGCDGALLPPLSRPTAPPVIPPPLAQTPVPDTPLAAAPPPPRCDFTVTLQGDETFAFNRAGLTKAARTRLDSEVLPRLTRCSKIELLAVTGHTDRLGSQAYNQRLSTMRARAVASYLQDKGVPAEKIRISGAGETLAVQECSDRLPRKQLIACLAANRRVTIDVRGPMH